MSAHGVIHILDSTSGKARPLKLTSDKLGVNDSVSQASLSNIESSLAGTLTTTAAVTKSATQIANAQSVVSGDFSNSSHNCSSERELVIVGTTTDMSNNIDIWISNDNSTYYKYGNQSMYPDSSGNFGIALDSPFKYIKVKFNGSGTVTALVMGSN